MSCERFIGTTSPCVLQEEHQWNKLLLIHQESAYPSVLVRIPLETYTVLLCSSSQSDSVIHLRWESYHLGIRLSDRCLHGRELWIKTKRFKRPSNLFNTDAFRLLVTYQMALIWSVAWMHASDCLWSETWDSLAMFSYRDIATKGICTFLTSISSL